MPARAACPRFVRRACRDLPARYSASVAGSSRTNCANCRRRLEKMRRPAGGTKSRTRAASSGRRRTVADGARNTASSARRFARLSKAFAIVAVSPSAALRRARADARSKSLEPQRSSRLHRPCLSAVSPGGTARSTTVRPPNRLFARTTPRPFPPKVPSKSLRVPAGPASVKEKQTNVRKVSRPGESEAE